MTNDPAAPGHPGVTIVFEVMTTMVEDVEQVELPRQRIAVVHAHVRVEEIPAFVGAAFAEVMQVLEAQGLAPTGPPFSRYTPTGDGIDVEAGFPTSGDVTPHGRVIAGELPDGPAARVLYRGDYAGVAGAYETAVAWASAHGYVASGSPWESYLDGPDVAEPRTVVCLPVRPMS